MIEFVLYVFLAVGLLETTVDVGTALYRARVLRTKAQRYGAGLSFNIEVRNEHM